MNQYRMIQCILENAYRRDFPDKYELISLDVYSLAALDVIVDGISLREAYNRVVSGLYDEKLGHKN